MPLALMNQDMIAGKIAGLLFPDGDWSINSGPPFPNIIDAVAADR